jgi:hypothetical protein
LLFIDKLFVNLEDSTPNYYFYSNQSLNVAFLSELWSAASSLEIGIGVYTTRQDWANIFGSLPAAQRFSSLPLWVPRYDGERSLDFFSPFGGWTPRHLALKQISG